MALNRQTDNLNWRRTDVSGIKGADQRFTIFAVNTSGQQRKSRRYILNCREYRKKHKRHKRLGAICPDLALFRGFAMGSERIAVIVDTSGSMDRTIGRICAQSRRF
jgi:hypothetical protein